MTVFSASAPAGVASSSDPSRFGPAVELPRVTGEKVFRNTLLAVCGASFILPLLWLIAASFDAGASRQLRMPDFTLANFNIIFQANQFAALSNSLIISIIATVVATVPSVLAAYAFSRQHIPFKGAALMTVLFLSGIPINILIIPVYEIMQSLGLLSRVPTGIFLGVTSLPFELYIIKNAIDAIPLDLEEAARIEGAGTATILWRVVVPLALPGIAAAAIFGFVNAWGNFLAPLVLIPELAQQPSPIKVFEFMSGNVVRYGDIAAFSLVYAAPVVLLYLLSGRVFRSGFVLGGAVR